MLDAATWRRHEAPIWDKHVKGVEVGPWQSVRDGGREKHSEFFSEKHRLITTFFWKINRRGRQLTSEQADKGEGETLLDIIKDASGGYRSRYKAIAAGGGGGGGVTEKSERSAARKTRSKR